MRCAGSRACARETKPPPRYGEAALLAAMEGAGKLIDDDELREAIKDSGLGTPATRAATIERLIEVGYVVRDGRSLRPTQKGIQVIDLLGEHELTSPELTGAWENRLLEMERGAEQREAFMQRRRVTSRARSSRSCASCRPSARASSGATSASSVPRCGKGTLIENRKGYGCSTWKSPEEPGCGFVIWKSIAGKQITEDIVRELIANGRTKELPGFRSRAGKPFRAMLVLDPQAEQPVTFEFKPRRGGGTAALEDHREHDPEGQRADGEGDRGASSIAAPSSTYPAVSIRSEAARQTPRTSVRPSSCAATNASRLTPANTAAMRGSSRCSHSSVGSIASHLMTRKSGAADAFAASPDGGSDARSREPAEA